MAGRKVDGLKRHPVNQGGQRAQREGMGLHRHRNRGNQDLDATDADDLGSGDHTAAYSQADKNPGQH